MIAMQSLAGQYESVLPKLDLLVHPHGIRARAAFPKESLTLVCCSTKCGLQLPGRNLIECKVMDHSGTAMIIMVAPHIAWPLTSAGEANDQAFVAPFWFASMVTEKEEANLQLQTKVVEVASYAVHVPILTNPKKVAEDTLLAWFKAAEAQPKAAKRPRSG